MNEPPIDPLPPPQAQPSAWVLRWTRLLAGRSKVLDLACGSGRHTRWLAARGHEVTAADRDPQIKNHLGTLATICVVDLEASPWPFSAGSFDAVVVTNYLWRPRWPELKATLAPGGVLIYETFSSEQARWGRPRRPEFLLQAGELIDWLRPDFHIVAYEEGLLSSPTRAVQRIAAIRHPVAESASPFLALYAATQVQPG